MDEGINSSSLHCLLFFLTIPYIIAKTLRITINLTLPKKVITLKKLVKKSHFKLINKLYLDEKKRNKKIENSKKAN